MDWINKHRGIVIVVVLIIFCWPLIVNWLYNVETDCKVLHKPQEWTIFWGSYIGSIISAAVAFIILFLQRKDNKEENEKNRTLQLDILKQQQEMQWLNAFRQAYIEYVSAYSIRNIQEVVNIVKNNPNEAFYLIKTVGDRMVNAKIMIEVVCKQEEMDIKKMIRKKYNSSARTLTDISSVIGFYIKDDNKTFLSDFLGSIEFRSANDELKIIAKKKISDILSEEYNLSTQHNKELEKNILFKIVSERFQKYLDDIKNNNIEILLFDYIKEQEKRINAITDI